MTYQDRIESYFGEEEEEERWKTIKEDAPSETGSS